MKKVLVTTIARPKDWEIWGDNINRIYDSLTYEGKDKDFMTSEEKPVGDSKYSTHCVARNKVIDLALEDEHDYVFWIDPDIVRCPENIIERLLEIESENIIAPYVFIEPCDENPWKFERFFDIDFFIDADGNKYNFKYPYHNTRKEDDKYACSSVGTCMLVPADVYRKGAKYNPMDYRGDHVSFCESAAKLGYKTFSTDEIIIEHAFLPKYGLEFH